jgi:hypothetical protein
MICNDLFGGGIQAGWFLLPLKRAEGIVGFHPQACAPGLPSSAR